jgi:stage III sporulation protein AF
MDWLGGWLKTVIMVILLATFVDLLLPSKTLQRYVKTVMSLFILLTLLSPILELFQSNWNVDQMLSSAVEKQSNMDRLAANGQLTAMTSLETITQEANKLKAVNEKQSQELLQTQIAAVMREELQKQTELQVVDVGVAAKIDNNGRPVISDVQVTLHEIEKPNGTPGNQDKNNIAAIAPIQPVHSVQIDLQTDKSRVSPPKSNPSSDLLPSLEAEKQKLIQSISSNWMLQKSHIEIRILPVNRR